MRNGIVVDLLGYLAREFAKAQQGSASAYFSEKKGADEPQLVNPVNNSLA
jgi:hypothetical protein